MTPGPQLFFVGDQAMSPLFFKIGLSISVSFSLHKDLNGPQGVWSYNIHLRSLPTACVYDRLLRTLPTAASL